MKKSIQLILLFAAWTFSQFSYSTELDSSSLSELQLNNESYKNIKQGDYLESFRLAYAARVLSEKSGNLKQKARALSNMASSFFYLGDYTKALSLYKDSLKISLSLNDYEGIDRALNNIPSIYNQLEDFESSLNYRKQQYALSLKHNKINDQLTALIGLTRYYISQSKEDEASIHLDLTQKKLTQSPSKFLEVYVLLAESDLAKMKGKLGLALSALEKASKIAQDESFDGLKIGIKNNIAKIYVLKNNLEEAKIYVQSSLNLTNPEIENYNQLDSYLILEEISTKQENFKKAYHYSSLIRKLDAKLRSNKVQILAQITQIERNVEQTKERLLKTQNEKKIAELKLESQTQLQIIWTAAILVLFSLSFLWYYRRTSKHEIEQQKKLNEELKRLDKVKDRILTNTSHELRTPLNGIIGLSNIILVEHGDNIEPELSKSIRLIEKSGQQLSEIVNDILDLAKFRTYQVTLRPTTFNIVELAEETMATCLPLLKRDSVKMNLSTENKHVDVYQDRARLKQVLFNLIGNAIKFTEAGEVLIAIKTHENKVIVEVCDTGIGIPEDMQTRVFEGFEQVNANNNRQHGGSGLGLAISKEILTAMDSEIHLTSTLNKGTVVSFSLPIHSN